jgi:hypothetical protein
MIPTEKQIAECYQPLSDILSSRGLDLSRSEMDDIIDAVEKVNKNLREAWRVVCDVQGCNMTAVNQGGHWKDSGYWCVCTEHSQMGRDGKLRPRMKREAIEREKNRINGRLK